MTAEVEYFRKSNPWFDEDEYNLMLKENVFIVSNVDFIREYDVVLDTSGPERRLRWGTLRRVIGLSPEAIVYNDTFLFSKGKMTLDTMKDTLQNDAFVGMFNFSARGSLVPMGGAHQLVSDARLRDVQLHYLMELMSDKRVELRCCGWKAPSLTRSTARDAMRSLVVSSPPNKCDILVCRAAQVCAMPDELIQKICTTLVVHYGTLSRSLPRRAVDARSFSVAGDFSTWWDDMKFVCDSVCARSTGGGGC
jgi:hypothetical protein